VSRLPVHELKTDVKELDMGSAKIYHLPDWHNLSHPERLVVMRQIASMRGRDPRIAKLALAIIRKSKAKPRQYKKQAAALLKWVQNPKNCFYINEPGERLQDPIYTIRVKHGDCFAEDTLVLRVTGELVPIQQVKEGDLIWGKDDWTTVEAWTEKGKLSITEVCLNNGSVLRLTEGHKVYVRACCGPKKGERFQGKSNPARRDHGPGCAASASGWKQCEAHYGSEEVRIKVSELREGMQLVQPERITRDVEHGEAFNAVKHRGDAERDWLIGAYIAEGWAESSRMMLSGKDGHWKEATKQRAKEYAEERSWPIRWDTRYIAINSPEAAALVGECGKGALNKRIPDAVLIAGNLDALDDGLKLDASQNTNGNGWTFGTVSRTLAIQYRVLQRMLGRSTSLAMVTDHGGYGSNPIYRVGVRSAGDKTQLRVKAIHREAAEVPCYDIQTADHYVYLPEADCTVSNCDDMVLLLCCLFESINLPWKQVLSGRGPNNEKIRYIEGQSIPPATSWAHIYCMVGTPPFQPNRWFFCEPTVQGVPLGWDVIDGDHRFLPEMVKHKRGGPQVVMPSPVARRWHKPGKLPPADHRSAAYAMAYGALPMAYGALPNPNGGVSTAIGASIASEVEEKRGSAFNWQAITLAIFTGVTVSVGTQLTLDWVRGRGMWEGHRSLGERWPFRRVFQE